MLHNFLIDQSSKGVTNYNYVILTFWLQFIQTDLHGLNWNTIKTYNFNIGLDISKLLYFLFLLNFLVLWTSADQCYFMFSLFWGDLEMYLGYRDFDSTQLDSSKLKTLKKKSKF